MVIPKGKKFQFRSLDFEAALKNQTSISSLTTVNALGASVFKNTFAITPAFGYLGNAYIGQDINIGISSQFSKPLESILGKIPHSFDLIAEAATGTSLNNSRFTHMKYWTGTEPPEINVTLIFETQIDSYYDVYKPIIDLMRLALPYETTLGFYKPPVPALKFFAAEAKNFITGVSSGITTLIEGTTAISSNIAGENAALTSNLGSILDKVVNSVNNTGFITNLYVGNNFRFENIMIKSISPTFSSDLAYAPIYFINKLMDNDFFFNPYTAGETVTKLYAQTVCAMAATINNATSSIDNIIKALPSAVQNLVKSKIGSIPSYPIKAEVNMTFELQFPITRNRKGNTSDHQTATSIDNIFFKDGFQDLY